MKPVPIARYLNQLGQAPDDSPAPRQDNAPPRPRPILAANSALPRGAAPMFRKLSEVTRDARARAGDGDFEPANWLAAQGPAARAPADDKPAASFEARIEEAYARGARDGAQAARVEGAQALEADLAAQREKVVVERLDFHLNEYAQLANVVGAGLVEIEERLCAAVTRILAPFVESRVTRQIIDELGDSLRTLRASGAPTLMRIRGPERLLHLLRERVGDLAAEVEYVAEDRIEIVVEARDTRIESQLGAWSALIASLDS